LVRVNLREKGVDNFLTRGKPKLLRLAVASVKGGCTPHISSVWYLWYKGYFWITTSEDRLKVKAIRENPKVALMIDTDMPPYKGVIVEGSAKLTKEDVEKITLAIVKRYVPQNRVERQFESLMRYPRILINVKPKKSIDIMSYKEHK
jgi:general stress protein 26